MGTEIIDINQAISTLIEDNVNKKIDKPNLMRGGICISHIHLDGHLNYLCTFKCKFCWQRL